MYNPELWHYGISIYFMLIIALVLYWYTTIYIYILSIYLVITSRITIFFAFAYYFKISLVLRFCFDMFV